jgi:hypothetical protein
LNGALTSAEIESVFKAHAPGLLSSLSQDLKQGVALTDLWTTSVNVDENTGHTIVHPPLLRFLTESLGLAERPTPKAHAGLQHTYGYLFSTELTAYGFKRERWISGAIQKGLGLTTDFGLLSSLSGGKHLSLLSQVSLLLGSFALTDDAQAQAELSILRSQAPKDLQALDPARFPRKRIREKFTIGERAIEIRTDLIELAAFKEAPPNARFLLVYSIRENGRSRLVTGFPVSEGSALDLLKPENFGEGKTIKSRYNASIEGMSAPVTGSRTLEN